MKQIALALAIFLITFSQGIAAAQEKIKKDTKECPQLKTCKESLEHWNKANALSDADNAKAYKACLQACPINKETIKECSTDAYNLLCRNKYNKIVSKKGNKGK